MNIKNTILTVAMTASLLGSCDILNQKQKWQLVSNLQQGQWTPHQGKNLLRDVYNNPKAKRTPDFSEEGGEWGLLFVAHLPEADYSLWIVPDQGITKLFVQNEETGDPDEYVFEYVPTDAFDEVLIDKGGGVMVYHPEKLNDHIDFLLAEKSH